MFASLQDELPDQCDTELQLQSHRAGEVNIKILVDYIVVASKYIAESIESDILHMCACMRCDLRQEQCAVHAFGCRGRFNDYGTTLDSSGRLCMHPHHMI